MKGPLSYNVSLCPKNLGVLPKSSFDMTDEPVTEAVTLAVSNHGECGDKTMEDEILLNLGLL